MSTQSQLPATRKRQSLESPTHPLVIPEILGNIFSYLPNTALVRLTYVNKLWRLEARHRLYQNRSEIIYNLLKWCLHQLRLDGGILHPQLRSEVTECLMRVTKFRLTFNINLNTELFAIRNKLKDNYIFVGVIYEEKADATLKADKLFMQDPGDTEKYNNFRRFQREVKNAEKELLHALRDLCNFEFFLKYYRKITDPDEIDHINIRLQNLREWVSLSQP